MMVNERPLEEWIKNLSEASLQKNIDRRSFLHIAGKIAGLSLGFVIAQSIGDLRSMLPQDLETTLLHLVLLQVIRYQTVWYYGQDWLQIRWAAEECLPRRYQLNGRLL